MYFFNKKRNIGEWFELTNVDILQIHLLFETIEGTNIDDNLELLNITNCEVNQSNNIYNNSIHKEYKF